ncbi:hypothetical protein [Spirosoma validum]|uniref:Uncharacterized protein n=1 Tax=Spirosoma validum TaxID=2771355 RepID=A0A927B4A5_9BACT|nr:hypothetical protein [Spirosoma validum]MBD2754982.1 hypothetical protein [Spirosoma validum]
MPGLLTNDKITDSSGWIRQYTDLANGLVHSTPKEVWVADIAQKTAALARLQQWAKRAGKLLQ